MVQRQVLYLGELNDNQRAGWVRMIEAVWGEKAKTKQLALFPDEPGKELPILDCETIRVRLDKIELCHPREWGASWLGLYFVEPSGVGHILEEAFAVKP